MLERVALYITLALVLYTVSIEANGWTFWAIMALFWCSEHLTRRETELVAMAEGISKYLNMTLEEQNKIKKIHQEAMKEKNDK